LRRDRWHFKPQGEILEYLPLILTLHRSLFRSTTVQISLLSLYYTTTTRWFTYQLTYNLYSCIHNIKTVRCMIKQVCNKYNHSFLIYAHPLQIVLHLAYIVQLSIISIGWYYLAILSYKEKIDRSQVENYDRLGIWRRCAYSVHSDHSA